MSELNFEIKALKISKALSEETLAYTATLYVNGQRAARLVSRGHGGPVEITFIDRNLETFVIESLKGDSDSQYAGYAALEYKVDDLVVEADQNQQIKRWCKTKTIIKLRSHGEHEFLSINRKYDPSHRGMIEREYLDLQEILNERFCKQGVVA